MATINVDDTKARQFIKQLKDECKGYRHFYRKIHGREPSKQDVQTLINHVNRSNYDLVFMLRVLNAFDLYHVTFAQFFNGELPPRPRKRAKKASGTGSAA